MAAATTFVPFTSGNPETPLAWMENLCEHRDFPLCPRWSTLESIGKGTFGSVYTCTLTTGQVCAVKVILDEDGDWVRKCRPRWEDIVHFLKTKKLPKKKHRVKEPPSWAHEAFEVVSEIEYARYMGREGLEVLGLGCLGYVREGRKMQASDSALWF